MSADDNKERMWQEGDARRERTGGKGLTQEQFNGKLVAAVQRWGQRDSM